MSSGMIEAMTRIFGWAADDGPCGYYRIGQPLSALKGRGHDTLASTAFFEWSAQTILGQRLVAEDVSNVWQHHARTTRLVMDLDDDYWAVSFDRNAEVRLGAGQRAPYGACLDRFRNNIAVSDAVTVTTARLAHVVAPLNRNVQVIPNAIPDWLLTHERPRCDRLMLGWEGGDSHRADWQGAAEAIGQFIASAPNVGLHVMGDDVAAAAGIPADRYRFTPWTQQVEQHYRRVDFDIGLAPLARTPFNNSKSPIRALEYGALGIPVVASAVGPYLDYVQHGVTGYLVRRHRDWGKYLRMLVADDAMRAEMGAAARRQAAAYTVEQVAPLWEKTLTGS